MIFSAANDYSVGGGMQPARFWCRAGCLSKLFKALYKAIPLVTCFTLTLEFYFKLFLGSFVSCLENIDAAVSF